MLKTYAYVAKEALRRSALSWVAALSIPIYGVVFIALATPLTGLGMIGGFILGFVGAAFLAGYLFLLQAGVAGSKIRFSDLRTGLRGVWNVVSVLFALMILGLGLQVITNAAGSRAPAVLAIAQLAGAFFFNVIPELLYNSSNRSFMLLKESVTFVMQHAFAWFPPNIIFALVLLKLTGSLAFWPPAQLLIDLSRLGTLAGALGLVTSSPLWLAPILIVLLHFMMVFRGLLYQELTTGNSRMREFRQRMSA
jgi:hypothetical protein